MSTVQAHRVIKFRFIRLISILIKTLTPPYAIKNPRRLFFPHGEREMDRSIEWTRARERERGQIVEREKMSSATAAECDSASKHQLTSPDNNGEGLFSILCIAQDCTSPLSQQQLRSSSKGKVKMEITLCSCSPPLMNLISPHYPSLHSVSLIQNNTPSALISPLSGGKQRRALCFLSLFF